MMLAVNLFERYRLYVVWGCVGVVFFFFMCQVIGYRRVRSYVQAYEQMRQERSPVVIGELDEPAVSEEELFMVLNRTPDYLRDTAISFAHANDLGDSVTRLYAREQQEQNARSAQTKNKRKQKRKASKPRRRAFAETNYPRWDTLKKKEPVFDLPIDKDSFWLSSPFGMRRNPGGGRGFHFGIDMAAVRGTPVKAAGDGVVIQAGNQPGYGNIVVIKHDTKFKTRYAHLSKILIKTGAQVTAGQVIGKVGSTGNTRASGKTRDSSHLHFEVEMYGKRVNPFYFFK